MLHPSTKRLIDKLGEMTRKQRVSWEESDNDSVKHDTEGYRVTITAAPHALLLTDTQGREIETCTPEDFTGETDADGRPYADFIEDLYREAHRHARGAEKAISALLSSLDEADADDSDEATEPEPETPLATAESFDHPEDEGDESYPLEDHELPEPEYEGQAEMQAAIATMADQMRGTVEADAHPETAAAAEPEPEPVVEPPVMPVASEDPVEMTAPEADPEPEQAPVPETEPYTPFAGSGDTARPYAVAAEFAAPAEPEPPAFVAEPDPVSDALTSPAAPEETPAAPEPFSDETHVWESIRNAGAQAEPESEPAPEPQPEPEPVTAAEPEPPAQDAAPATARPGPVFGSGMFSDLSHYRAQTPAPEAAAEPEPEAVAEAAPAPEPFAEPPQEPALEPATEDEAETVIEAAPEPSPEPAPDHAPAFAPEDPAPQRSFSLSGITSGFGLGSTHSPARPQQDTQVASPAPGERRIIDGTVDLPDTQPEPEVETPAEAEWRMEQDEDFGFTPEDLKPGIPASPLPAASEAAPEPPAQETQPEAPEAGQEPAPPHRPSRRFNPWN
ncbi:hypothetical protein [Hyphomonas sp.]|uniref:hypothetical protein n=1 Tax=Hyphomonas sp. TaxID=87 RepID=UPI000C429ACB|nr:hypothetical protein [Hyphomonas sp.]MAU67278.1 hypothetical protein [Hyphomonas sp.]